MTVQQTPPSVVPAAGWTFPAVAETRLPNGIRMLAYHCPGQHVFAASLLFDVPLIVEPRDLEGVAGLTGRCLTQGAAGLSAEDFADALVLCGADLDASASTDGFTVRLNAPVTHLGDALALMTASVVSPDFVDSEFEHEKRLRLQEIEQAQAYPQHVAVEQLNAALFAEARAARPSGGSPDTVEAISRADVVAYAAAHLQPSSATFIIAGDFRDLDPVTMVQAAIGDWRHQGAAVAAPEVPRVADAPQVWLVDTPDAPQATLRVGGRGITRDDPRWPAMFVANFAVGGNFSSRINTVLREEKGVTYGANSSLDTGRGAGVLTVSTAVRSDAAAASVADLVSILADAVGSLSDEEVRAGVRAATDSAPLGFERAEAVVSRVETLIAQGLPLDHVDRNLDRIRQVTRESANAAYAEILQPDALTVVVVGDASSLRGPLQAWGYADVREVTPEQR